VGFAALPGCSPGSKGGKKDEGGDKKDAPKGDSPAPKVNGTDPPPKDVPPKNTLGTVEEAADKAATAFRASLVQGTATPDMLSASFLKAVGKPTLLPSDKEKGFSVDSAGSWLKKVGDGVNFGLETKRPEQAGDVVFLRGPLQKPGGYSLRLVKEGGAWKVDWLSLTSVPVEAGTTVVPPTPEGAALGFAVAAFVETASDVSGMPEGERAAVLGAALTPALRAQWAPPFEQDKAAGYDFNPAALVRKALAEIGSGVSGYTATRVGDLPEFKVEVTKPAGKKTYTVKLVKGAAAHEWLVTEVSEAKG
jgi:hypothetical protein